MHITLIDITGVYLSLNRNNISNHGYVVISNISTSNDGALLCNTNYMPSGGDSGGNWYAPDETRVRDHNNDVPGVRRTRGPGVVRLRRDSDTPAEGIYRCTVRNASRELQNVYVGLYNRGGGVSLVNNSMTCTMVIINF